VRSAVQFSGRRRGTCSRRLSPLILSVWWCSDSQCCAERCSVRQAKWPRNGGRRKRKWKGCSSHRNSTLITRRTTSIAGVTTPRKIHLLSNLAVKLCDATRLYLCLGFTDQLHLKYAILHLVFSNKQF
jgi:hypothetical protein